MPIVPLHASFPSQSPVWQVHGDLDEDLQPVLAQKRPHQFEGIWTSLVLFLSQCKGKPPSATTGKPALGAIAGHTGNEHLLVNLKETWPCPSTRLPETMVSSPVTILVD